jgi:CheY-like chemotaxis protein
VVTASDGAGALQADFMFIVTLDRNMPGMDGLERCRRIRQQTWPGYVYLMLLTAHEGEEDVLLGRAPWMNGAAWP